MEQVEEEQERSHQLAGCLARGAGPQPQPPPSPALSQQPAQHQALGGAGLSSTRFKTGRMDLRLFISSVPDPDPRDHMILGLPDPDPLVRGMDPAPDSVPSIILLSSSKSSKKNIDFYCFVIRDPKFHGSATLLGRNSHQAHQLSIL